MSTEASPNGDAPIRIDQTQGRKIPVTGLRISNSSGLEISLLRG